MPRLVLFRHAQAVTADKETPRDHERGLTQRGRDDAAQTGRGLAAEPVAPDLVLCSTAARTRQTWEQAAAAMPGAPPPKLLRSIYEAGSDYLAILAAEGGAMSCVVIVGHNPTIARTALILHGASGNSPTGDRGQDFPTAAAAIFDFDGAWASFADPDRIAGIRFVGEVRPAPAAPH